ncbi:MAG: hypothetical protein ACREQZ_09390, partial [Woeseiaceae bacterium]
MTFSTHLAGRADRQDEIPPPHDRTDNGKGDGRVGACTAIRSGSGCRALPLTSSSASRRQDGYAKQRQTR